MSQTQKILWLCCLLGLLGAGGAYYLGKEQDRIRSLYGPAPQPLTVADLAAKGYGDNIWLDLTNVELGKKYVIETRKGSMSAVWVPAFPRGQAEKAQTIQVILRSTKCKSDADIAEHFGGRTTFCAAVTNPILLKPYEPYRPLLQQTYPSAMLAPTIWEVDIDYCNRRRSGRRASIVPPWGWRSWLAFGVSAGLGSFMTGSWRATESGSRS